MISTCCTKSLFLQGNDALWRPSGWENLCTIAQYRECDEIIGEPFRRGIYLTITTITGAVQTIDTMAGRRYKISATIFCKIWGSHGLRGYSLTAQFFVGIRVLNCCHLRCSLDGATSNDTSVVYLGESSKSLQQIRCRCSIGEMKRA